MEEAGEKRSSIRRQARAQRHALPGASSKQGDRTLGDSLRSSERRGTLVGMQPMGAQPPVCLTGLTPKTRTWCNPVTQRLRHNPCRPPS